MSNPAGLDPKFVTDSAAQRRWFNKKRFILPLAGFGFLLVLPVISLFTASGRQGFKEGARAAQTSPALTSAAPSTTRPTIAAPSVPRTTTPSTSPTTTAATGDPVAACFARPAVRGDIFLRITTPGQPSLAQELGGGWSWNSNTNTCMTSVDMNMASAPHEAGFCTEAALVSDNPGYNPDGSPAAPLKKVIASVGGGC